MPIVNVLASGAPPVPRRAAAGAQAPNSKRHHCQDKLTKTSLTFHSVSPSLRDTIDR